MPEPLVPVECDLRGLPFMPLYGERLIDSDLFFEANGDEFKAALALWWASWKQIPAASLPDNDRVLAGLARVADDRRWAKIKAMALHGWVKCSDGRLYHPVVAEFALEAWEDRQHHRAGQEAEKERKRAEREERRRLFADLKAAEVHLAWNTPMADLRARHAAACHAPVTDLSAGQAADCPGPVTAIEVEGTGTGNKLEDADASSVGSAEPITTARKLWERDADFLAAWALCTERMRTRSSRKSAHAAWRQNWAAGEAKVAALRAYLAADPDVQRTGGPGFHLWLRDKLPEWLDRGSDATSAGHPTWAGPPEVAAIMARAFGPEKGPGYLAAYCTWQDVPTKALVCSKALICDFIRREAGAELQRLGVAVVASEAAA
jgi:uncharacterized protein YdaU (DUF1376 family)